MITPQELRDSITEAERFIAAARAAIRRLEEDPRSMYAGTKETGAVRRASLDLTRQLAELRRGRDYGA